jgi:hypothetical protein
MGIGDENLEKPLLLGVIPKINSIPIPCHPRRTLREEMDSLFQTILGN